MGILHRLGPRFLLQADLSNIPLKISSGCAVRVIISLPTPLQTSVDYLFHREAFHRRGSTH
jgi:hypothetical protein